MASVFCAQGRRLVGAVLSPRQYEAAHRAHLRRLPLRGLQHSDREVAEWNVGCERCHGPGSAHVEHATRANILNPARMDEVSASDTCIQCHSQGRPLTNPVEGKYYD